MILRWAVVATCGVFVRSELSTTTISNGETAIEHDGLDWNVFDANEGQFFEEWAQWSSWTTCSRTCGGGVYRQYRRCLGRRCSGRDTKEEICNQEPCSPLKPSFRQEQCSRYNNAVETWISVAKDEQCVLQCQSEQSSSVREMSRKADDGTECHLEGFNRSLCVDGKCQHIGCDGVIGSSSLWDQCGVCAGKGDSCGRPQFRWIDTEQFSPCDHSCGANSYRVSVSMCTNTVTGRIVPERLCADQPRPRPVVQQCVYVICPAE